MFPKVRGDQQDILLLETASSTSKVSWTNTLADIVHLNDAGASKNLLILMNSFGASRLINL
jgi:hypothetical protein